MHILGSNIVVVAGAQGIGLAYCEALIKKGAKVRVFVGVCVSSCEEHGEMFLSIPVGSVSHVVVS